MTNNDLTELDGVGPARSDYLRDSGFDTFEAIANTDNETLAEEVDIPEDTALELIVQSQNIVAEAESDGVTENEPDTISDELEEEFDEEESLDEFPDEEELEEEELEEEEVEEATDDDNNEDEDDSIEFSIGFEQELAYDTFFDSVMQQRMTMYQANRSGVAAFDHALDQMRDSGMNEPVKLSMDASQLNDLHSSVSQMLIEYKGNNLIDHMDALQDVMNQIEEVRSENLF